MSETWLKSYNTDIYELDNYYAVHKLRDNDMKGVAPWYIYIYI